MRHPLLPFLLLIAALPAAAQHAAYHKLSPLVREAATLTRLQQRQGAPAKEQRARELSAFVRVEGNADSLFLRHGVRKLASFANNIHIVSIPLQNIGALSLENSVTRIESSRSCTALMDTTRLVVDAHSANEGIALPQAFDGEGVLVGVQDIGFDLTHPTFYDRSLSRYRIQAMWDQLSPDTLGSPFYVGRDYRGMDELLKVGRPFDGDTQTHGTHTAGIAAGSGYNSPYVGIAPAADLCLVCNATGDDAAIIDSTLYYKYTSATDALGFKYIFDHAERTGKPCVINFSEGAPEDTNGDDQLYYEVLNALVGPGRIIVASAGNAGHRLTYFRKPCGEEHAGLFLGSNTTRGTFSLRSEAPFTIRIKTFANAAHPLSFDYPSQKVLAEPDSLLSDTVAYAQGRPMAIQIHAYTSPLAPEAVTYDVTLTQDRKIGEVGTAIDVRGNNAEVEFFYNGLWTWHSNEDPTLTAGEQTHSIHSPSAAPRIVCAGATTWRTQFVNYLGETHSSSGGNGLRADYSSVGPTLTGCIKPDVVAPGTNVISAYSSFFIANPANAGAPLSSDVEHFTFQGRTYAWNANTGTSMSTPVVAGAIALWLQARPTLTPEEAIETIKATSRKPDPSLAYPNNLYGHGEIDAYRGLLHLLGADRIEGFSTTPLRHARATMASDKIILSLPEPAPRPLILSVFGINGALLLRQEVQPGQARYEIPFGAQQGIYLLQVDGGSPMSTIIRKK